MAEVFVNYRTKDGDEAAEHITAYLSGRFGKEHVFKASHSIPPGDSYPQSLIGAAQGCDVLLSVMGPDWGAAPQLEDEADWVRKEILAAQSAGARVIPVLKGRETDRLVRDSLPPELRWLAEVQSFRLDMHESTADLARIGDFLADLVAALKAADRSQDETGPSDATRNSANGLAGNVTQGRDFTGDARNVSVNDTHGPTMAGDNNTQYNLNYINERLKEFQKLTQPIDHLQWLAAHFVPPPGFEDALAAIKEPGTVILAGPPGAGRTAAAQMLVFLSWSGNGELHELDPQGSDEEAGFHIDPALIRSEDGVWVDLSDASLQHWNQIQRQLPTLYSRAQKYHARLIVIQPPGSDLRFDFRSHLRLIGAPPAAEVFSRLLRTEGLANGEDRPAPAFPRNRPSMADIRQFVDDISSAKEQASGKGELKDWIAAAEQPTSPRETQVGAALDKLRLPSERALLLSVAMLHGAHADMIDRASVSLLARLPDESNAVLERPPLGVRLRKIGAETDTARHVRFLHSGYDAAVRLFFWRHFPELHEKIAIWVGETLVSADLSDSDRTTLARGFAAQCLGDRYKLRWTKLVKHLTEKGSDRSRELPAAAILQVGLNDEANSRTFRRQIYDWAVDRGISTNLAEALVAACKAMPYTHHDEALVRLHHIARRHPRGVGARDALTELACSTPRLLSLLLSRLTRRSPEEAWETDAVIFLDIADASRFTRHWGDGQPLIGQDQIAGQLAAGWALAFTRSSDDDWASPVGDWLRCAAGDDVNRHLLLGVLIDGARQAPTVLPQLYWLARRAAFRDVIADLVLEKMSAAQGVELA
jgi:TIR domain